MNSENNKKIYLCFLFQVVITYKVCVCFCEKNGHNKKIIQVLNTDDKCPALL